MNIVNLSFVVTAIAVVLASVNVIIRATQSETSMLPSLILLGFTVAAFVFSLIVINNSNKKDENKPKDSTDE